ncbi:unnamed protein product [marine sediment metagenome]|uniref:Uncharacterized protein n=1 Tax=marine sediment metagenome TaxID=412755 RepID=X1K9F7_9ZZZZ
MAKWIDVLRSTPWVLGLALLLATVSEAYHLHRCRSGSLARVLSQGSYSVSLNIGMVLFSVGLVLTARALPERLVCGGLGLFYSGRLIWRWRRRFGAAQPAPPRKGAQGKPATSADPHSRRCAAAWRVRLDLTEILAVALAALPLWFPDLRPGLTACALLLLAVVWLAVALLERSVWPRCSYDLALAVLLLMATVGALVSATPALGAPNGTYELYVQKQAGTNAIPLRVSITASNRLTPQSESLQPDELSPNRAIYATDLLVDRRVAVTVGP